MTTGNAVEIPAGEVPTRDQIALEDTWDLSGIYPEESAWEGDADRMSALVAATVNTVARSASPPLVSARHSTTS